MLISADLPLSFKDFKGSVDLSLKPSNMISVKLSGYLHAILIAGVHNY